MTPERVIMKSGGKSKPVLGLTMGDPAGIGPEIVLKAFLQCSLHDFCRPLVIGDAGVFRQARDFFKFQVSINPIEEIACARFKPDQIDVLDLSNVDLSRLVLGKVSAMAGEAAFQSILRAIELAKSGSIAAVVTAPIHKAAINRAGYPFAGHTEIFAHYTATSDYAMMLAAGSLRVVHVSTHLSLRRACEAISKERLLQVIRLGNEACRRLGIARPRIGVPGLNPHAGDAGLFGDEETLHIIPAIEEARADGFDVQGPFPPDTFYPMAAGGAFDIALAMYHDQGHIPVKMLGFKYESDRGGWTAVNGINVTLGLPILRVSVDHGTAFDQAGRGTASPESLIAAIEYAARMAY